MKLRNVIAAVAFFVLLPFIADAQAPTHIYQHIGGGGNIWTANLTGNNFKIPLPNSSGAGNAYILSITYDGAQAVSSVTGVVNGSFGTPAVTALGGSGNQDSAIYVLPNITSGFETVTVTFAASVRVFQYNITEVYGVATASPLNGTASTALATTTTAGSFTPGNNNANGGNLLWAYFIESDLFPDPGFTGVFPTLFSSSSGFLLLNADSAWNNGNNSLPKVVETEIQATSAAINPGMTYTPSTTGYHWNSLAVALKLSPGAGTAPAAGLRINGIQHLSTESFPSSGTYKLQVSATGNLRVLSSTEPALIGNTVTDSDGNTWTPDGVNAGFWYVANTTANPNLVITMSGGSTVARLSLRFTDISGAATTGTFNSATASPNQVVQNLTTFTASPSPSPTTTHGLTIANVGLSTGPGLAATSPSGAIWDLCTYTGETDNDTIENADIMAHFPVSAAGAQTWTFTITSQPPSNITFGGFATFVGQTSAGGSSPGFFFSASNKGFWPKDASNDGEYWPTFRQASGQ